MPPRTSPAVVEYLLAHPGVEITSNELQRELHLTHEQIQNTISRLRSDDRLNIDVVVQGQCWRFMGNGHRKSARLYEEIGKDKNGIIIIQDEDGNFFKAVKLS